MAALLLVSCGEEDPMTTEAPQPQAKCGKMLFEDPMTGNWQEKWFLDGKKATLEHRDGGLCFFTPPSNVDKNKDRATFDAHHAVLWTKQEFEGDIRISYEFTRIQSGWANLLYIQAQGIGTPPYEKDIHAWRELREVASMEKYYNYMNLLSLSLREEIRCKRYPWNDVARDLKYEDVLVEPMAPHDGLPDGKTFRVVVEKRKKSCTIQIREVGSEKYSVDYTWDLSNPSKERKVPFVEKGRIGLRQMGGNKVIYRDFSVQRL